MGKNPQGYSYTSYEFSYKYDKNDETSKIESGKDYILDLIMKKYNITENDLKSIEDIKVKLRDFIIDEVLK